MTFTVPLDRVHVPTTTLTLGCVVTYSYESNARRAVPVNPIVERVRPDLQWDRVVDSFYKDTGLNRGMLSFLFFMYLFDLPIL